MNPDTLKLAPWPDTEAEQEKLQEAGFVELPAALQPHAAALMSPTSLKVLRAKRKRERQNRRRGRSGH